MSQDRRQFLATLGAAAFGVAASNRLAHALPPALARRKLDRIGIQLYTVRREFNQDPAATLARLAQIGYKEVEFAGYAGRSPADIRAMLAQNGLTAPSTHLAIEAIEQNPQKVFGDARTAGHQWLTVPSLPRGKRETLDDWKRIAEQFNRAGAAAKQASFRFAFHNHGPELKPVSGVVPLELLIRETDPALVSYQMDIYWVVSGGGDPLDLLARYPDRFTMVHVKDSLGAPDHKMVDVGAGKIDFAAIFARAPRLQHYFIEHDQPVDAFAFAKSSFDYLAKLEVRR